MNGIIGGLQREQVRLFSPTQLAGLQGDAVIRWKRCGAVEAAEAVYHSRQQPDQRFTLTVVAFADDRGAFCGFGSGRQQGARPVMDLEGSYETKERALAWRSRFLAEVRGPLGGPLRDFGRGLLRASAARMPGSLPPVIPGGEMLPDNSLVSGSESIVLEPVFAGLERSSLQAQVHCDETEATVFVIDFDNEELAAAAMEKQKEQALENFLEVAPLERAGATGVRIRGHDQSYALFVSGHKLVGLMGGPDLEKCNGPLAEIAARASPMQP